MEKAQNTTKDQGGLSLASVSIGSLLGGTPSGAYEAPGGTFEENTSDDAYRDDEKADAQESQKTEEEKQEPEGTENEESQEDTTGGDDVPSDDTSDTDDRVPGSDEDDADEEDIFEELNKRLGVDLPEDSVFDQDYDGLASYVSAVGEQIAEQRLAEALEQIPDVRDYMMFRLNGGKEEEYFQARQQVVDYSNTEFDPDNLNMHRKVVFQQLVDQGFSQDDAQTMVEDYENAGILKNHAQRAFEVQKKRANETFKEKQARIAREREAQLEAEAKRREEIMNHINSGKINDFIIPEAEKNKFYRWKMEPAKNGMSQRDELLSNLTVEQELALEYILYKGLDLKKIATANANTKKAKSFFKKAQSNNQRNRLKGGSPNSSKSKLPRLKLNQVL